MSINGRIFDPRTRTHAYADGSGFITSGQVIERGILLSKIIQMESESAVDHRRLASLKLQYLTFYETKPNQA